MQRMYSVYIHILLLSLNSNIFFRTKGLAKKLKQNVLLRVLKSANSKTPSALAGGRLPCICLCQCYISLLPYLSPGLATFAI